MVIVSLGTGAGGSEITPIFAYPLFDSFKKRDTSERERRESV